MKNFDELFPGRNAELVFEFPCLCHASEFADVVEKICADSQAMMWDGEIDILMGMSDFLNTEVRRRLNDEAMKRGGHLAWQGLFSSDLDEEQCAWLASKLGVLKRR